MASKSKKTSSGKVGAIHEPISKATISCAYNQIDIVSGVTEVTVEKKNLVLSTQWMLALQSYVWKRSAEIQIKKITIVFCPLVEPGDSSTVTLNVDYDVGTNMEDFIRDETVVRVTGRISEGIAIVIRPTKPIIKRPDMAFYCPWQVTVNTGEYADDKPKHTLGIVKIWCHIDINPFKRMSKVTCRQYVAPLITWTNVHYPYYVPFYMKKQVRGICPIYWRDTEQYKIFRTDVANHVDPAIIKPEHHLFLMQSMSRNDASYVKEKTKSCHAYRGGTCNCKDEITEFISSVMQNSSQFCREQQRIYDAVVMDALTGKTRTIDDTPDLYF